MIVHSHDHGGRGLLTHRNPTCEEADDPLPCRRLQEVHRFLVGCIARGSLLSPKDTKQIAPGHRPRRRPVLHARDGCGCGSGLGAG